MEAINLISLSFALGYLLLLAIFLRGWLRLRVFVPLSPEKKIMVSVIIAARNEAPLIKRTIESLLSQTYDKELTEIIFVDDHSTDNTAEIIRSYKSKGIRLIQLNEAKALNSYKKKAIQTAISICKGKLIVTTDADCTMGEKWLESVVSCYERYDFKMISSPVAFYEEKSFFERAQSLEFMYLIGLGASTIGNRMPTTCNGANLAYEKEAFLEVGGFKGIDDLASGDDELLLHKIAAKYPNSVGFLKNRAAIVYTHAKPTLRAFIQQRKRWASKSTRYKNKFVIILGIAVWIFNLSLLLNILCGIYFHAFREVATIQLAVKVVAEMTFLYPLTNFNKRPNLLWLLPVLSILHILYIVYIGIAGNSGRYNWKDRMVR